MDGILIIDKPAGMTSHDVVNHVRRILKTKRVGHTGTLDPFATGVLVLLVGKATRLAQFVDKATKEYVAEIRFGFATDTSDLTGKALGKDTGINFSAADLEKALDKFRGEIEQIPPMYSAKKLGGKKLYEHARKGEAIERKPSKVTIDELTILETNLNSSEPAARIRVVCSAGTYIRALAEDIGKELGTGAHLTALRRTIAGEFTLADSISLEELEAEDDPSGLLLPIESLVSHLPIIQLPPERIASTLNGMSTRIGGSGRSDQETVAIVSHERNLVAIGIYDSTDSSIKPKIVLV